MTDRTQLEIRPRRVLVAEPIQDVRTLLALLLTLLLTVWLGSAAIGQCNTMLQSGGPIAALRGSVSTSVVWDPDGAGPLPQWLVVGGLHLTGGDQTTPTGLLAYDGTQWRGLNFTVDQQVLALTVFNGELIAGGSFTLGGAAHRIARRNATTWQILGSGMDDDVRALTVFAGSLVAGGRRRSGTTWSALGTGVAGGGATVRAAVRATNGDVFAGGSFTTAGGNAASNVARWNGSAWAPLGTGTDDTVLSLLIAANGDLIAGGDFTSAGGVACNRIARWNGTAWSPLASGMDDSVRCLAELANGQIVAGGTFLLADGNVCDRIAIWNGVTWSSMAGGMNGAVNALALRPDGELAAGGAFTTAGGVPRPRLARWDGSTWLPLGPGVPDTVNALVSLPDGDVLIGGAFAAGTMNHLARWDGTGNGLVGVGAGVSGPDVLALAAAPNGDVFVGGDFDAILPSLAAGNLAIMRSNCPAVVTSVPTACVGPGGALSLGADTLPWLGSTFRSTATGFAPSSLAISVLGSTPVNLPLSSVLPIGLPNCNLLAAPDVLSVTVPVAGSSQYQFTLSSSPAFAGVPLSHQFVQLQFAPSGTMLSLSNSNALTLVPGLL